MSPYHYQHATFFTLSTRTMFFRFFSLHSSLKFLFCPHSSFHLIFAITFTYHNLIQNSLSNGPNKGWLDCKIPWAMAPTRNGAGMILISIRKGSYKTRTYLCLSHYIGIISVPSLKHQHIYESTIDSLLKTPFFLKSKPAKYCWRVLIGRKQLQYIARFLLPWKTNKHNISIINGNLLNQSI